MQYGKPEEQYQTSEYSLSCLSEKEEEVSIMHNATILLPYRIFSE